jgi:hypothetical protein
MVINGCRKHDSFEEEINKKIWTIGAKYSLLALLQD